MFSDINGQTDIKLFIYNLSSMEEVSKQLAKYHNLMTCDIHSGNLIVDKDSDIIVVDTTHFIFEEYNDPITTFRYNMKALANTVLYEIFKNIDIKDSRINQLYLNAILDGKCKPSYVLYETLRKLEIEMKSEVNTYEEFTQGLRLIKK